MRAFYISGRNFYIQRMAGKHLLFNMTYSPHFHFQYPGGVPVSITGYSTTFSNDVRLMLILLTSVLWHNSLGGMREGGWEVCLSDKEALDCDS